MKTRFFITTLIIFLFSVSEMTAQRSQRRQQRKHRKVEHRLEEAERNGKINSAEAAEIDAKEDRYHRTKDRATRNGRITSHEHRKMKRQNRRLGREVRRAD